MATTLKSTAPKRIPAGAPVSLHPRERETVVAMVTASVEFSLDRSSEDFREMPSAERFAALQEAMYAYQFWKGKLPEARGGLAAEMYLLPVTQWVSYLRSKVADVSAAD